MENLSMIKAKSNRSLLSLFDIIEKNEVNDGKARYFYDDYRSSSDKFESSFDHYGKSYQQRLNNVPFDIPDETLVNKIMQQVEYLFSDENLLKDKFLLKHIRRNKEGFVSLKLISSLRKVKALSKDWRVIAYSLEKSQKLKMNDEKAKIKRIDPLHTLEKFNVSKTVLVFHYLPSSWTLETITEQLKKLGNIISVKTINSNDEILNVSVKKTIKVNANIATFPFAIVKFETPEEAANAVLQTSHVSSVLKIIPLVKVADESSDGTFDSTREGFLKYNESYVHSNGKMAQMNLEPSMGLVWNKFSDQENLYLQSKYTDRRTRRFHNEDRCQEFAEEKPMLPCSYKGDGPINNPRPQRSCFRNHKPAQVIVIRQPKGPDGTKGFWHPRHPIKSMACAAD